MERDPDIYERADYADVWAPARCRCGSDMPGICPGPTNCPMCATSDDEEDA